MKYEIFLPILHSSFFIKFCEAKFLRASRFASLASGYPLHHPLRAFGTLRVVPLLSLSLRALSHHRCDLVRGGVRTRGALRRK
jgi:hypothetical protein